MPVVTLITPELDFSVLPAAPSTVSVYY